MFAPPVAKPLAKTDARPTRKFAQPTAQPTARLPGVGRESAADRTWNFGQTAVLAPRLLVGRTDDPLEQDADRIARQALGASALRATSPLPAMASALRRQCACAAEMDDDDATKLQRRADGRAGAAFVAPPIVHAVLGSPGMPLDPSSRNFFEPRFGRDLGAVRLHTDDRAAASAKAVGAHAYTVGTHIAFAANRFAPATQPGRELLAHELAHVLQNAGRPHPDRLNRFAPAAEAEVEPEAEEEGEEESEESEEGEHAPGRRRRGRPSSNTLQGRLYDRADEADTDQIRDELELPRATVDRGGAEAQKFLEQKPKTREDVQTKYGTKRIEYTPTVFHLLDALEADIARATSSEDLLDIYRSYFPDSAASHATPTPAEIARPHFRAWPQRIGDFAVSPADADSGGTQRTPVFVNAAKKRTDLNPKITTDPTIETILQGLFEFEARAEAAADKRAAKQSGPCRMQDVPRAGGSTDHNDYATFVTGNTTDFEVATPGGPKCKFDGRDGMSPQIVWEVKTRHEWSTPQGIPNSIFAPRIQGAILQMEEQLARCLAVAKRCGLEYRWAFENKGAADFLAVMWSGKVKVEYRPRP